MYFAHTRVHRAQLDVPLLSMAPGSERTFVGPLQRVLSMWPVAADRDSDLSVSSSEPPCAVVTFSSAMPARRLKSISASQRGCDGIGSGDRCFLICVDLLTARGSSRVALENLSALRNASATILPHSRRPVVWLRPRAKAKSSGFCRLFPAALPVPCPCPTWFSYQDE